MGWGDSPWGDIVWGADTVAPLLVSLQGNSRTVTLVYSEPLDPTSIPPPNSYTLAAQPTVSGTISYVNPVTNVTITGNQVTLTLLGPLPPPTAVSNIVVCVNYTAPATGKIRDLSGNNAANLVLQPIVVSFTFSGDRVADPVWTYKGE